MQKENDLIGVWLPHNQSNFVLLLVFIVFGLCEYTINN